MHQINFTDLPGEIKSKIFKINMDRGKVEYFKKKLNGEFEDKVWEMRYQYIVEYYWIPDQDDQNWDSLWSDMEDAHISDISDVGSSILEFI